MAPSFEQLDPSQKEAVISVYRSERGTYLYAAAITGLLTAQGKEATPEEVAARVLVAIVADATGTGPTIEAPAYIKAAKNPKA